MPRKKTEELAVIPEAPVLPIVPEETAEQPVTEECLPENAADPVVEDTVPTEGVLDEPAEVVTVPEDPQPSEKPKRTVRKRTAAKKTVEVEKQATPPTEDAAASAEPAPVAVHQRDILTLDARGEAETQAQMEDIIWHEIHNAYRTRRMLSGMLSGIERTEARKTIAIVDYKEFRIDRSYFLPYPHINAKAVPEALRSLQRQFFLLLDHTTHIIRQSAVGIGHIAAALDHDDLRVFIQTAEAGGGRRAAGHAAYDHNFHLAPSTKAAISALGR